MTIEISASAEKREIGDVNDKCRQSLNEFFSKSDHKFKDYAALKTGGMDTYSYLSITELLQISNADINEVKKHLGGSDIGTALRWNCRGLSLKDSIRKVLVDKEIQRNAYEASNRR